MLLTFNEFLYITYYIIKNEFCINNINLYVILDNWLCTNTIKLSKIKTFFKNDNSYIYCVIIQK